MYRVVYYRMNQRGSKVFNTFEEAMAFWAKLPFEAFSEMYKI